MKCRLDRPTRIRVNDLENPIGVDRDNIGFSYIVHSKYKNSVIGGYRIVCADSLDALNHRDYTLWDSGTVMENRSACISYAGKKLESGQQVYFQIGCYDREGSFSGFSSVHTFEIALTKFQANWVCKSDFDGHTVPLFLHSFAIHQKKLKQARLYISGLGYFESFVNGKKTDDFKLKPTVTVYDKRPLNNILDYYFNNPKTTIYFCTFDITKLLQSENILSVLVGNGWYYHIEKQCEGNFSYQTPRLIYEIHLEFENGSHEIIASGKDTRVKDSPIIANTLFKGETIDFRLVDGLKNISLAQPAMVVEEAPTGVLTPLNSPCDRVRKRYPAKIISRDPHRITVDFGKNHSGVLSVTARGNRGDRVTIVYGEEVYADKRLNHTSTSWGVQIQTDEFILSGNKCVFTPHFTFHGYRYAELTLQGDIDIDKIESVEINTDCQIISDIRCSLPIVNDINRIYQNTQLSNLHGGFPSDCPHREKRAFLGDGQVAVDAALTSFDLHTTYMKWIKDIVDSQDSSGYIAHTAPFSGGGGGCMYGSAIGVIPLSVYKHTLDKKALELSFEPLLKWIRYLNTRHNGDYVINREEQGWCLGDWLSPTQIYIDADYVNTCAMLMCCMIYLEYSAILGVFTHCEEIKTIRDNTKKAIYAHFFDAQTFNFDKNHNGANILALVFGAVEDQDKDKVVASTLEYYRKNPRVNTGIVGTKFLFKFLSDYGAPDLALQILKNRDYPSYGYMLDRGATTLWECWEEETTPNFFINKTEQMNGYPVSHNHPMFGSVNSWLFSAIAGIDLTKLDQGEIVIHPLYLNEIDRLQASQLTPFGKVGVAYQTKNKALQRLRIEIPVGLRATVNVYEHTYHMGSGVYSLQDIEKMNG